MYLPTFSPAAFLASISVASIGWFVVGSTNLAGFVALTVIGIFSFPDLNVGVPDCGAPWIPSEPAFVPTGLTSVTVGVYVVLATLPLTSSAWTLTPEAFPWNVGSGVNVITPLFNSYVPSFGTVKLVTFAPSAFTNVNVLGTKATLSFPLSKFTVVLSASSFSSRTTRDVCDNPWNPVVSDGLDVGFTSVNVGV